MADGEKKKSNDMWHKDNYESTLKKLRIDKNSITAALSAVDANLEHKIAEEIKKNHPDKKVDFTLIQQGHENYNESVAEKIKDMIDKHYVVGANSVDPYGLDADLQKKLGNNYFTSKFLEGQYFGHKESIMKSVGQKDFDQIMKSQQQRNLREVSKTLSQQAVADVDEKKHEYLAEYFLKETGADKKKVSIDLLKRNLPSLVSQHLEREQVTKEDIYSLAYQEKKDDKAYKTAA